MEERQEKTVFTSDGRHGFGVQERRIGLPQSESASTTAGTQRSRFPQNGPNRSAFRSIAMHSKFLQFQSLRSFRWSWVAVILGWVITASSFSNARAEEAPVFSIGPSTNGAFVGGTVTFSVSGAGSNTNLYGAYAWYFANTVIAGQTNSSLVLTNLSGGNAGNYFATASGIGGSITSSVTYLNVSGYAQPQVVLGNITTNAPVIANGTNTTDWYFPVTLQTIGFEYSVSFTLSFNSALLTNPRFFLNYGFTNAVTTNAVTIPTGLVVTTTPGASGLGVSIVPTNKPWPGLNQALGYFQFTPQPGADFSQLANLALNFDGSVVGLQVTDVNGQGFPLGSSLVPQIIALTPMQLDSRTGLFEQQVQLANPGTNTFAETVINVQNLTNSPLGIQVQLMQTLGVPTAYSATFYGGPLGPNSNTILALEYYVADRKSVPLPLYSASATITNIFTAPPGTVIQAIPQGFVRIHGVRTNAFLVEWLTKPGLHYYVQYSDTLGTNSFTFSRAPITGNGGYMQWIDSGPPNTSSVPGTNRFYQVLQTN